MDIRFAAGRILQPDLRKRECKSSGPFEPGHYVERWTGDGLRRVVKLAQNVESSLLPGLSISMDALFHE